jgi:hypothetical protein
LSLAVLFALSATPGLRSPASWGVSLLLAPSDLVGSSLGLPERKKGVLICNYR